MIIGGVVVFIVIAGFMTAVKYRRWRDGRDLIALNSDLWNLRMPYEHTARERRL